MSRIAMNMPNTMIRNAISRRAGMRSDGAAVALIMTGGVAVAFAMGCSGQDLIIDRARRPMRKIYCGWIIVGASRSASLSASVAPALVSTVA